MVLVCGWWCFCLCQAHSLCECAVIVLEVWPEASGRKSSILNKAVTVDTDTPFKGWQGVQDILSLSMLSFHVLKRGLLPLVMTKSASFLTKNLRHSLEAFSSFSCIPKNLEVLQAQKTHRNTLPKITWLCCCQHIILPAGNHFPLQGK